MAQMAPQQPSAPVRLGLCAIFVLSPITMGFIGLVAASGHRGPSWPGSRLVLAVGIAAVALVLPPLLERPLKRSAIGSAQPTAPVDFVALVLGGTCALVVAVIGMFGGLTGASASEVLGFTAASIVGAALWCWRQRSFVAAGAPPDSRPGLPSRGYTGCLVGVGFLFLVIASSHLLVDSSDPLTAGFSTLLHGLAAAAALGTAWLRRVRSPLAHAATIVASLGIGMIVPFGTFCLLYWLAWARRRDFIAPESAI